MQPYPTVGSIIKEILLRYDYRITQHNPQGSTGFSYFVLTILLFELNKMQCIPLPKNPTHWSAEIRLFSDEGYDGQGVTTYPERQGWSPRPAGDWARLFDNPPPKFVDFLERWLFFSYAHLFSIGPSNFIEWTGNPKYPVLTTRFLPTLLERAHLKEKKRSYDLILNTKHCMRMHGLLCAVSNITRIGLDMSETKSLMEFIESNAIMDPRRPIMVMATSFLIEATMAVLKGDASLNPGFTLNHELDVTLSWKWDSPLWKLLRNDGWCPSELVGIFSQSNASSLWFLHHLPRPASHRTHPMIHIRDPAKGNQQSKVDDLCTALSCAYKRLNDESYVTKHTASCQGCDDVVANLESLCSTLGNREIPLIAPVQEDSTHPEISFHPADPDCAYIAISHVWSDGLGNPHRNALPRCQLVRLSNIALSYHSTPLFWLDTLCVPPDTAGLPKEQKIALELMRKTYEDAKAVIVLDSWPGGGAN
ncbi:hypothetical protein FLAG1_10784 [Fusarium langsethiae]|uniref:Heterokaryon incompatibility domain-containing protein n=1 Tax=Fusarium langsethiae TaxID=179993 RepID=A0A0M9ENN3_FUSLA|nr:hypothetical protein FLAG1_10784 [Fusarium langsethiae]